MRWLSGLGGALGPASWWSLVDPSLDRLVVAARRRTSLSDLGRDALREGLAALCRSPEEGAGLSLQGRLLTRGYPLRTLCNRHQIQDAVPAGLGIADEVASPALLVIGAWLVRRDPAVPTLYHRDPLRLLQRRHPKDRWVLNGPVRLFALEPVLAVYPDAAIVQAHPVATEVVPPI